MPDVVTEHGAGLAPTHPLDPLTPDEIRVAARLVRVAHDLGPGMTFETITLQEPPKDIVHAFRAGGPLPFLFLARVPSAFETDQQPDRERDSKAAQKFDLAHRSDLIAAFPPAQRQPRKR